MAIKLTTRFEREICFAAVEGRLILSPLLPKMTRSLVDEVAKNVPRGVVLDLADAGDVDSAGLGELLNIYKELTDRKMRLALIGVDRRTQEKLELTHLQQLLPWYPSGADAEAAIRKA